MVKWSAQSNPTGQITPSLYYFKQPIHLRGVTKVFIFEKPFHRNLFLIQNVLVS